MSRWRPKPKVPSQVKPRVIEGKKDVSKFITPVPAWWYCTNNDWCNAYYNYSPNWSKEKRTLEKHIQDVRLVGEYQSLVLLHLKTWDEAEEFYTVARSIGLYLKGIAYGKIPQKDYPYDIRKEL